MTQGDGQEILAAFRGMRSHIVESVKVRVAWTIVDDERGASVSDLSYGEVGEILHLLQEIEGAEVHLEWGDLKIQVRRGPLGRESSASAEPAPNVGTERPQVAMPEPTTGTGQAGSPPPDSQKQGEPVAERSEDLPDHWVAITAPMAGTCYRAPKPDEPPFVEVGDVVAAGDTVALIEVMKLYTELKAEVAGKIARVEAVDGALVEFGQALVWIEPA